MGLRPDADGDEVGLTHRCHEARVLVAAVFESRPVQILKKEEDDDYEDDDDGDDDE